ncbi:ubiquinone biosynthesis protein UbiJ [Nocardiopsis mwathae]|uniref:Ubiquinone biosynthesis protein UbiJ n=1 Tax=Nocardiopsis mwathae TaxID=1472723 RepID=A0A7W9YJ66_9ACTN|nr:hypothetical protein [Nocardiopsis mwathae]MBB6172166.1 ubiquinone biosynthesis protein UbiJ [Nocardiopsis mwathae]
MPAWINGIEPWYAAAAGAVAAVGAFAMGARRVGRMVRRVVHLVDDLAGEPERAGVEARPGLMERVAALEERVEEVRHEVQHNNGGSLKDAVKRTEDAVHRLTTRVDDVEGGGR